MKYKRMPIEIESPEQLGYDKIKCNLTESSMPDMKAEQLGVDIGELILCYTDHAGMPDLREMIASEHNGITSSDVIVTVGAAAALFIISTSMLEREDRILVARPNYATNIETPRAIGCGIDFLDLSFEEGFAVDTARLRSMITPSTKLISVTTPHNPTGSVISEATLRELIGIAESAGLPLLVDETYRDMAFNEPPPLAASLSANAISVSSLSKTYGMPGIRAGWIVTKNPEWQELFLAAKEQIFICNSVVDEYLAAKLFERRESALKATRKKLADSFAIVKNWMESQSVFEWVEPRGGAVCFPRVKPEIEMDMDRFYNILNDEFGTYVGPGHWFEMPRRHMRIGYGWPSLKELTEGLENISRAAKKSL